MLCLSGCSDWQLVGSRDTDATTGGSESETDTERACDWSSGGDGLGVDVNHPGADRLALTPGGAVRASTLEQELDGELWFEYQDFLLGEIPASTPPDIRWHAEDLGRTFWQAPESARGSSWLYAGRNHSGETVFVFSSFPESGAWVDDADGFLLDRPSDGDDWPAIADVDGDGVADLLFEEYLDLVVHLSPIEGKRDFTTDADLTFGNESASPTYMSSVSVADVNGDGHVDVLGAANQLHVVHGPLMNTLEDGVQPDFTYTPDEWRPERVQFMAEGGDLNDDGEVDLLVSVATSYEEQAAAVLLTDLDMGQATAADAGTVFHYGDGQDPGLVHMRNIGDVNSDGFGDLAAVFVHADDEDRDPLIVYVLMGPITDSTVDIAARADATVTFDELERIESIPEPQPAGDVDGDGAQDWLVGMGSNQAAVLFLGCESL